MVLVAGVVGCPRSLGRILLLVVSGPGVLSLLATRLFGGVSFRSDRSVEGPTVSGGVEWEFGIGCNGWLSRWWGGGTRGRLEFGSAGL